MEKTIFDVVQGVLNCLPPMTPPYKKSRKKDIHYDYSTFFDMDILNCIMYMYSHGILITDITHYVGLSEKEVNKIIDAYVDCLV